jgi:hypothetical protein
MTNSTKRRLLLSLGLGALGLVLGAAAPRAMARSGSESGSGSPSASASQSKHEIFTVKEVDHEDRELDLTGPDGKETEINVPKEVTEFDTLKVGDRVDVTYTESVAMSLMPLGKKPSMAETKSTSRMAHASGGTATRETTAAAEIVAVDPSANTVTLKGPKGNERTVTVDDPALQKKLPSLKVGQYVKITYTQALAASIRKETPGSQAP